MVHGKDVHRGHDPWVTAVGGVSQNHSRKSGGVLQGLLSHLSFLSRGVANACPLDEVLCLS